MWKISTPSSILLVSIFLYLGFIPNETESIYYSSADLAANNYEQLNALVKDYIKLIEKVKAQQTHLKPIRFVSFGLIYAKLLADFYICVLFQCRKVESL